MRKLESVHGGPAAKDPFVEQLQRCPEVFTAGEMVGKLFETLKYDSGDAEGGDRLLPPAALVMPLV